MLNDYTQIFTISVIILVISLINLLLSGLLMKLIRLLVFLIPGLLLIITLMFFILALITDDFGKLIYFIFSGYAAVGFIGSIISSLFLFFFTDKQKNKNV